MFTQVRITTAPETKSVDMRREKRDKSNAYNLSVGPGKRISLKLSANATTGFEWKLRQPFVKDNGCVKFIGSEYKTDTPKGDMGKMLTGVGGWETMTFEAVGKVGCEQGLELAYAQPWNFKSWDRVNNLSKVNIRV